MRHRRRAVGLRLSRAAWEPLPSTIDRSFQILFMIIIGGLGSILGSFLGAAFIMLLPIFLNHAAAARRLRLPIARPWSRISSR